MEKKEKKRHKIHDRKVELYDILNNQKDTCFKKILYYYLDHSSTVHVNG